MQEKYSLEATKMQPGAHFDAATGVLCLEGRSIPENSTELYGPMREWIRQYCENPQPNTVFKLYMHYFNTSSSSGILSLFQELMTLHESGSSSVSIEWYFDEDDDDLKESGEAYQTIVKLPWELKPIAEPITFSDN